jgi:hypothetical protein
VGNATAIADSIEDAPSTPVRMFAPLLAQTLPSLTIANVSAPGVASQHVQFHFGDNFLFQETQTNVSGRDAFRYGVGFPAATDNAAGWRGRSGRHFVHRRPGLPRRPSASISRVFGAKVFHPDQLHQSYFFRDTWKATPALAVTFWPSL